MVNYAPSEFDECPACGYDLRDVPVEKLVCPECGRVAPWHLPHEDKEHLAARKVGRAHRTPWWYAVSMILSVGAGWLLLRVAPIATLVLAVVAVLSSFFAAYSFLGVQFLGWGLRQRSPWVALLALCWALVVAMGLLLLLKWV